MGNWTRPPGPALFYMPSSTGTEDCLLMVAAEEPRWGRPVTECLWD